jgi:peptidoglycan/xylan/chitin deacetylase (PgdA/CDA1 family)
MIDSTTGYLRWIRDRWRLGTLLPLGRDRGTVLIVLFHGLFRDHREATSGVCDPQQGITVGFFAEFVESLLAHGATIRELEDALRQPRDELTVVITFDDGYFSNAQALGVLAQFGVPATFYISTKHVEEQKAFWWDVVYREAVRRGAASAAIRRQIRGLKRLRAVEIETLLVQWFGSQALRPVADCDRPFTEAELTEFARSPYVSLGNHTGDHAILVNYDVAGIRNEIDVAQQFLTRVSGAPPRSIAYPNGGYDARVIALARTAGLAFGLTVQTGLNTSPAPDPMELRRVTVWGLPGAVRQAKALASAAPRRLSASS